MRILFVGSVPDNNYDRDTAAEDRKVEAHEALWLAAGDLGRVASSRGHTLMVGSDRQTTIDHHVVRRGLFEVAGAHPDRRFFLEVYRPDDAKRPFEGAHPPNVQVLWFARRPGLPATAKAPRVARGKAGTPLWLFAHQSAIASADVVIAGGGTDGTRMAVFMAQNLGVPVLPVAAFGGGSRIAYEALGSALPGGPDTQHLSAAWPSGRSEPERGLAEARATGIVRLAESVGLHSYFLSYSHAEPEWCDLVQLALYDHGRNALRDRNELRAGKPVQQKLYEAIGRAETFILIWSCHSSQSAWCQKELGVALELNRQGLPPHRIVLLMRDAAPLPASVADRLQLDVSSDDRDDARVQVDHAVGRLIREEQGFAGT